MAEFIIHSDDLSQEGQRPIAEAMTLLKNLIVDESILYNLDLALTEACANVAKHAYAPDLPKRAQIHITTPPDRLLEIEISDWGQGFDYNDLASELPDAKAETGRGIPLMTSLCDRVTFYREDNRNVVKLSINIPAQAWYK